MRARPDPDRDFPWWLLAVVVLLGAAYVMVLTDDATRQVLLTLRKGIWITILVTVTGFSAASLVGLGLALMSLSRSLIAR